MSQTSNTFKIGSRLKPYWDNRYNLFSKFDEGIRYDAEGLWSIKPEESASEIAKLIGGKRIVDAFCGIGGSTIAFALTGKEVIAIELNEFRLECAKHNAKIYGVDKQIKFILGDSQKIVNQLNFDSIYLDPPWVGNDYFLDYKSGIRRLSKKTKFLIGIAKKNKCKMGCTVPNTFDYNELRSFKNNFYVSFDFLDDRNIYSTFFIDFGKG